MKFHQNRTYYYPKGTNDVMMCSLDSLYSFKVYIGPNQKINLQDGESAWHYKEKSGEGGEPHLRNKIYGITNRNSQTVYSDFVCTVIKGYVPPDRTAEIINTNLPYINGCSTESLIPPIRAGDPTMQILYMPPNSSEQEEHIHSTVRVVYVLSGSGTSISGRCLDSPEGDDEQELQSGDVLILDKMVPHHFVTYKEPLVCSPLHVWSSTSTEFNHPMFNGTHLTNNK